MTDAILSYRAAEHQVETLANRRYKGKTADAIEREVKTLWGKLTNQGRRMLDTSAAIGIAIIALRNASKRDFLERLHALGITKSSAYRFMELAKVRAALPKNPPAELYGNVWTDRAALEFGKALFEDMEDDVPTQARIERAVAKVRQKQRTQGSGVARLASTLEARITEGLHDGDPDAHRALDIVLGMARRLPTIAKDLIDQGATPDEPELAADRRRRA
jgi:hypothetical protein